MANEANNITSNFGLNSDTTSVEISDLVNHSDNQIGLIIGVAVMLTAIIVVTALLVLVVAFAFKKRYGKMVDNSGALYRGVEFSVNYGRLGNFACACFFNEFTIYSIICRK